MSNGRLRHSAFGYYAKSTEITEFVGVALLDDLCCAFIQLKNGMVFDAAGCERHKYTGSLHFVLADTLAAHFLGGFK